MMGEKHFYYDVNTPFKDFMQKFSKNKFIEASKASIVDNTKINSVDLEKYHNIILENIPKDTITHIWVVYGYKKGTYYFKYQLGKYISNDKKDFFIQLNYHLSKKNNLIDSISFCIPKDGCKKINKYIPNDSNKDFKLTNIQNNNFPIDSSTDIKKYEDDKKRVEDDKKAIWVIDDKKIK